MRSSCPPELERAVPRRIDRGVAASVRPVLMFKVLVLQTQNNLSDERTEFDLRDRLTWMRFLGLGLGDPVPDANTIWTFREALTKAGATLRRVSRFDQQLRAEGDLAMSGQLVDASIVAAPKQRTTQAEKQAIREGRVPENWKTSRPSSARRIAMPAGRSRRPRPSRARADGAGRTRDPRSATKTRSHRSPPSADPPLAGDRCRGLWRRAAG